MACCLIAATVIGYSESPVSEASRTTGTSQVSRVPVPEPLLTDDQVNVWVKTWQARLGLKDWVIEAKIVRVWDLPQSAVANIHWSLPKKKATIKVLNSSDSTLPKSEIIRDTELSVVHELVHLSMAKLPLDPNHTELEEEAVKKLSVALMDLEKKAATFEQRAGN